MPINVISLQNDCNNQYTCDVFGVFLLKHRKISKPFYVSVDFYESVSKVCNCVCLRMVCFFFLNAEKNHVLFFSVDAKTVSHSF